MFFKVLVLIPTVLQSYTSSILVWASLINTLDLDFSLLTNKTQAITDDNTDEQVFEMKAGERSNMLSLTLMRIIPASNIKTSQL
jgi:hypothetical protein